jgi:FAD/FMN-containing dehydrogenase/Fe-S oxidoreductase
MDQILSDLRSALQGELLWDQLHRNIYATDASVYRKIPAAVCYPKDKEDLKMLIDFANSNQISLVPRTAGTSLAGQCVGEGIIVDTSRHFNRILEFDERNRTVTVEPGVIRDELNDFLKPFGLFFGPNTSTSNRCMVGGMVGNNSSGTTSIQYGVTRDKVLKINTLLSDGEEVSFGQLDQEGFREKLRGKTLESRIYNLINAEFQKEEVRKEIENGFPKAGIHRRNNGYALDALSGSEVFGGQQKGLNLSKLLCGSEGTLAFTLGVTLQLDELPPKQNMMVAAHFESIQESMEAVLIAMKHNLYTCELMDKTILDCTKNNREQAKNRFFVEGDPKAILMMELCADTQEDAIQQAESLIDDLKDKGFGYAFAKLTGKEIQSAFALRKAGLGLLGNIVGDRKAVACIEDTAVEVEDLPSYISEFSQMMESYGQEAVYYAHAGAGELHLRPILNLKKKGDVEMFREITTKVSELVKKYKGSMSGEHGDGIVRSEFLQAMVGNKNYDLMKRIKHCFDPSNIFNPGKIIDPWPMDQALRYEVDRQEPQVETLMDFSDSLGILRAAEKCNGSGDCRKPVSAGGTMCPSYRATKDEKDTTRARANALREYLTNINAEAAFDAEGLKEVFDLCLSCKACASECPSNVDVAALKAEFLYQYQKKNGFSVRSRLFAENAKWNKLGSKTPGLTNLLLNTSLAKKAMGVAKQRSIPKLAGQTFSKWFKKTGERENIAQAKNGRVYLFIDEFTEYYDVDLGKLAVKSLRKLGYEPVITGHLESGRSFISKGFLDQAKELAKANIEHFKDLVSEDSPLVGVEPSAILTFRDEYLRLSDDKASAEKVAANAYTFDEFLFREIGENRVRKDQFSEKYKELKIHGHCHQKSLGNSKTLFEVLNFPVHYKALIMNTGCCGMAGSFGYEKEHYELSMQVGEQSLFPKVRDMETTTELVAAGTSCRHQILDGTGKRAKHPLYVIFEAIK